MKALFVYPEFPETFWSLRHAIKFLGVKALGPPLALLTVAAMLPPDWDKQLVDLNVEPLTEEHLAWADLAFVSAMTVQSPSADAVIRRCRAAGVKICAGGVHYSTPGATVRAGGSPLHRRSGRTPADLPGGPGPGPGLAGIPGRPLSKSGLLAGAGLGAS
jgi:hypothetical protein